MIYDLDGKRYCMSSVDIDVRGYKIIGGSGLKAKETLEPGEVEGQSAVPSGYTTGAWSGDGSFSCPLIEALGAKQSLGNGFGSVRFSMLWTFVELDGDGVVVIEFPSCRFKTTDFDGGDRSKAAMITMEFKLLKPGIWNGVAIVETPDPTGGGFAISFTI